MVLIDDSWRSITRPEKPSSKPAAKPSSKPAAKPSSKPAAKPSKGGGALYFELEKALKAKHPTYKLLDTSRIYSALASTGFLKRTTATTLAKSLGVSVGYIRVVSNMWFKLGSKSNREYALEHYESLSVTTLSSISNRAKVDYRTIRRMLEREVAGLPQRAFYGSKLSGNGPSPLPETVPSLGSWGSVDATAGLEQYAQMLYDATSLRTRVHKTDSGVVEVTFKCGVEHELDKLLALLQGLSF